MFDSVRITVEGGAGGDGAATFHREKFVPLGGPDGGDGGRGGRIFLRAVGDVYTLEQFRSRRRFRAGRGGPGGPRLRAGPQGEDLTLDVPAGTIAFDDETGEPLADLAEPGTTALVAWGGRGGWGNKRFATSTNQAPHYSQRGHAGESVALRLDLRLLADVGLLGLPNAGKSTLLAAVSHAKPKIAEYPFTTLEPMLGVVGVGYERFTLADLPGLVEGASEGYGLGFEFLKHVRRCRVLLHVVDCSSIDPVTDYELIETEVRTYDNLLADIPRVVAVTKADLDEEIARDAADTLEAHVGAPVAVISAQEGLGAETLVAELMALVKEERERAASKPPEVLPVVRPDPEERFTVARRGPSLFVVEGQRVVTFLEMMDFEQEGARDEVDRRLVRWGVARALRREGVGEGDTVRFGEVDLVWRE